MQIYVVQPGDSLDRIAGLYGTTIAELSYANQIPYPYQLAVGQALLVPIGEGDVDRRIVSANGYAYPFISPWVLEQTMPYLTSLFVFSYGFTTEGQLIPPDVSEDWMIAEALDFSVSPILVLTPLGADGRFNNNLIHEVLISETAMETLISNLLRTMEEKGFQGVDVDFEYILAEDRDRFTSFVAELRRRMNAAGYVVSVALAPKTSADQPGLLYEGKDYGGLGAAADEVLLMAYEWGYTYGPAMAVAPLNKVRQVIEYALTEIPSEKINLGIPNYGYDWTLPYVRGESRAVTIGNVEAVQIAIGRDVPILFDETAQSPFFRYVSDGREHEVWFEDVRSLQAKYNLLNEYDLKGIGVWQIMRLFRAMWLLYAGLFYVE
ncbi:MAG: LysM peptidoglycan-binding domain-containing protein [Eubacterium sp.]|jgi:Predicted glycosyl hydrolase|nr:LysM peptidoglycan-binding domain-containing protein [Eubacterium sp.]